MPKETLKVIIPNIVAVIEGLPKSGKTHLAMTFPDPMVVFSLDVGADIVRRKFPSKKIDIKTYPIPIVESVKGTGLQKELLGIWKQLKADYQAATESREVKTIVVDTATALYEIARIARAAELGQENLLKFQFGEVYAQLKGLVQRGRVAGQNIVWTHYLKDIYRNDVATGELGIDGWRYVEGEADVILIIRKEFVSYTDPTTRKVEKRVAMITTIKDCRFDRNIDGKELRDATYEDISALMGLEE